MGIPTQELPGMGIANVAVIRRLGEDTVVAEMAQLGLDKVRINKGPLLERLKANREKHKKEFGEALEGWKGEVILKMKEHLRLAQEEDTFELMIDLQKPRDYTKAYDRVITMLEASIDDVIVISDREFQQYHEDNWEWKAHHNMALDTYSNKM
jgi:hypothetical protein